jgi:Putative Ig domain
MRTDPPTMTQPAKSPEPRSRGARSAFVAVAAVATTALAMLAPAAASAAMTQPASAHHGTTARSPHAGSAHGRWVPSPGPHPTVRECAIPARPREMACNALRRTDIKGVRASALAANVIPPGYSPASLDGAYKLSTTGGSGETVAIVDAFNNPSAAADLAVYRSQWGLPACTVASGCFRQVNETGAASPLPSNDSGWAGEESLDVDMVSAICPNCHIILVEASSASNADLYAAENDAAALGAKFISNSWGGAEYSGQSTDDANFNHPGVAITVSAGDDGSGAQYPATSRYVTAVGGTSLAPASNSRGWTETAWSGSGSGCSAFDAKPTWQTVTTSCTRRAEADVSAVADPSTGVAVYQTFGASGWVVYGGTSVAAPVIAGVYALGGTPGASDYPASYPYAHPASLFDVTSGTNGTCGAPICTAGTGWDGPTGLGTPDGTVAFAASTTSALAVANPGNQSTTVGHAVSLTVSASGGTPPYTWTATLPPGLTISSSTGVITGSPTTVGATTATVQAKDSAGHVATATFTWTVTAATGCVAGQLLGNPGFETGAAAPWSSTASVINENGAGETSHSGSWYAWLDGYGTTHTDTLSQSVTIAAGCTATLSFWLHIDTAETSTTTQFDKLTVTVGGVTKATFSNLNAATGYTLHTIALTGVTGTVVLQFSGTEDASLQTSFVIDDAAINVR